MESNIDIMEKFDINSIPDLDVAVIAALELFVKKGVPKLDLNHIQRPLVIGSGNAETTGKMLFKEQVYVDNGKTAFKDFDAVFSNESSYKEKLDSIPSIGGVVIVSASGSKHAVIIAEKLRKEDIEVWLLTCNPDAPAKEFIDSEKVLVFPKNREPYTYNVSTYLGMLLAVTKEDAGEILSFIKNDVDPIIPKNFADYDSFCLIVPPKFDSVKAMFNIKFEELLQPYVSGRVKTVEQMKHAADINESPKEMFIGFGYKNEHFGNKKARLEIPLPKNANNAAMMAIGYYVVGKIQSQHEPYFKKNIANHCKKVSELFGQEIKPIVD
ncbi:MAG: hypothetical protein GY861_27470 [bacterium]|nr:hypothetical protein [bacterium]